MLVGYEFSKFAHDRKSLRVSSPTGQQRSTYWLQLPYRYSIPLMCSMGLIHFFTSRGIYLVNIKVYDITGKDVPSRGSLAYATSSLALVFAFVVMTVVLFALIEVCLGNFKVGSQSSERTA